MAAAEPPKLSVVLSLSPSTYHFSNPTPPKLSLTINSNASRPLTLFAWGSPLWPELALCQRGFVITDLTTGAEVTQTMINSQRPAITRYKGGPDDEYYLTIHPGTPTVVSTPFGVSAEDPPQPKEAIQRGWLLDENGNELKIRRSTRACGVDGLEAGHRYKLDVPPENLRRKWWWQWGTRDEVLVDERETAESMLYAEHSEQLALDFEPVDGIEFSVEA